MSGGDYDPTDYGPLTRQQAENIADLAGRRAEERLTLAVGRSVIRMGLYALGAAGTFIIAWLNGWFHFGPKP